MSRKFITSLIITVFTVLLGTTDAQAWFRFQNKTSKTVWVAFQWYSPDVCSGEDGHDPGLWETAGWWKLLPGQTKTVFGPDLQSVNKYYYWYAEASDGTAWTGPFSTCVPDTAFKWCLRTCTDAASILGFREKYIGNFNNYTIRLVE